MKLKQLEYFIAIAEQGQITAAARKLHIAQPPLTYELKTLEEELGVKLVNRNARGVELTDAGKLFYQRAGQIMALVKMTGQEIGNYSSGLAGTISLGLISSCGGQIPNRAMARLVSYYPQVSFDIHEGNTFQLLAMLQDGIIDVGIIRTPFTAPTLQCRYGPWEKMAAVMPADMVCGNADGTVSLKQLAGKPLIIYRRFEKVMADLFEKEHLDMRIACLNDDARTTCNWAVKGFGIGILPETILDTMVTDGLCRKTISCDDLKTRLAVVWRPDRYQSALTAMFISMFTEKDTETAAVTDRSEK